MIYELALLIEETIECARSAQSLIEVTETDNWGLPAVLTVDETSVLMRQAKEEIEQKCAEGILPARREDGEWAILSDAVLMAIGSELAHLGISYLRLSVSVLKASGYFPESVGELGELADKALSVLEN